jgi:hypothetical protein
MNEAPKEAIVRVETIYMGLAAICAFIVGFIAGKIS